MFEPIADFDEQEVFKLTDECKLTVSKPGIEPDNCVLARIEEVSKERVNETSWDSEVILTYFSTSGMKYLSTETIQEINKRINNEEFLRTDLTIEELSDTLEEETIQ